MSLLRSLLSSISAGALALTLASACSDSSGDSGGGGGCDTAVQQFCSKLNSCFPFLIEAVYGDVATCTARSKLGCEDSLGADGSNATSSDIAACAKAYAALSCNELVTTTPDVCVVEGNRGDGEPCGNDAQCQSRNCRITSGFCGTCGPRSAAGGSCANQDDCQTGLECASGVCAVPVPAGGACTSSEQCAGLLVCKSGTCGTAAGAGESCGPDVQCDSFAGLLCVPTSNTCKSASLVGPGESCGLIDESLVGCRAGGTCVGATLTQTGTCASAAGDGASCTTTADGPSCLAPAECIDGTCQLPNVASCG